MSAQPSRFPYEPTPEWREGQQPAVVTVVSRADRIHWLSVWSGLFPALTVMILFGLFGLGVGFTGATTAGTATLNPGEVIWDLVTIIVAFLVGGFIASATSGIRTMGWGVFNGVMVFLVALPAMVMLGGLGLGYFSMAHLASLGTSTNAPGTAGGVNMNFGWSFILASVGLLSALVGGWVGILANPHRSR